jgi:hypothetical protein
VPELGFDLVKVAPRAEGTLRGRVDQLSDLLLQEQASGVDTTEIGCEQIVSNPASILDQEVGQANDRCNRSSELLTRERGNGTVKALARFRHGVELSSRADEESFDFFQQARHLNRLGVVVVTSRAERFLAIA